MKPPFEAFLFTRLIYIGVVQASVDKTRTRTIELLCHLQRWIIQYHRGAILRPKQWRCGLVYNECCAQQLDKSAEQR